MNIEEKYIERIKPIVMDIFKNDSSGHDIGNKNKI